MVCGPCLLHSVTTRALAPAAAWAMRSIAVVISCEVLGLHTRIVGVSMSSLLLMTHTPVHTRTDESCNGITASAVRSIVSQNHTVSTSNMSLQPFGQPAVMG